jgi:hypothetical protein
MRALLLASGTLAGLTPAWGRAGIVPTLIRYP